MTGICIQTILNRDWLNVNSSIKTHNYLFFQKMEIPQKWQGLTECALIILVVVMGVIGVLGLFGGQLQTAYQSIANANPIGE